MPQVSRRKLSSHNLKVINQLFNRFLGLLKNKEEDSLFLRAFLTQTETIVLSKRFAVLFLLYQQVPFDIIQEKLKVSSSTISRVAQVYHLHQDIFDKKIRVLIRHRELKDALEDMFSAFFGSGPFPPYSHKWGEWEKEKYLKQIKRNRKLRL